MRLQPHLPPGKTPRSAVIAPARHLLPRLPRKNQKLPPFAHPSSDVARPCSARSTPCSCDPSIFAVPRRLAAQASLRFFTLLLQYHHPTLEKFLSQYSLQPELYATSWFLTLFAHTLPLEQLFPVWYCTRHSRRARACPHARTDTHGRTRMSARACPHAQYIAQTQHPHAYALMGW